MCSLGGTRNRIKNCTIGLIVILAPPSETYDRSGHFDIKYSTLDPWEITLVNTWNFRITNFRDSKFLIGNFAGFHILAFNFQ